MKHKVSLYILGKIIEEIVIARNYDEAKIVALARHPNASVISVTVIFS
tara:strand:+ start:495 stop:638 length:144 start_codon:yes stop_codon:yes gene_type:complete